MYVRISQCHLAVRLALLVGFANTALLVFFWLRLPESFTVQAFGLSHTFERFGVHFVLALVTPMVILPAVFVIEAMAVGWQKSSLRTLLFERSSSSSTDIVMFVLQRTPVWWILRIALTFGMAYITGEFIRDWLRSHTGLDLSIARLPVVFMVVVLLTTHTFLNYWNHRFEHTRIFWPHHRFHHAADDFTVLTGDRFHPGDFPTLVLSGFGVAMLSVPPEVMFVYGGVASFVRYLIHSRIDSDWGWIGRYIVLSPNHHRAHHVLDLSEGGGGNFGLVPLWDALFGTLSKPTGPETVIGIRKPYRQGWWVMPDLLRDSFDFLRALARSFMSAPRPSSSKVALEVAGPEGR